MAIRGDLRSSKTGARARLKKSQIKVIDVSETPLKPNVLRKGKQVPYVPLDPKIVEALIRPDLIITPGRSPRVVVQSIPPGTIVARGASVDIVLALPTTIPVDVFVGGHAGFSELTVDSVVTKFLSNTQVVNAVLDFETADQLPAATRKTIERQLAENEIGIEADDPSRSFEAAFRTLKGAAAFR